MQREPRLKRGLPQQFFNRIQHERDNNHPHRYTQKEVQAIVRYVSAPTDFDPAAHRFPTQAEYQRHRDAARSLAERVREERKKTLAERIERPSLAERIQAPAPATPIAPKPILIDFHKHTPQELTKIFYPRLTTVSICLRPLFELNRVDELHPDIRRVFGELVDKLDSLTDNLETRALTLTRENWRSLEFSFKEIGKVSFKGLRANYAHIVGELARIYNSFFTFL